MLQNYQTSKLPTAASQVPGKFGGEWANPSNITADDGNDATLTFFAGGDSNATITGSDFGFNLPPGAEIDGISVLIDGSQVGCFGDVLLNVTGTSGKSIGTLNTTYGDNSDLWGADEITRNDVANLSVTVDASDVSGGDGFAEIDYIEVTVFWHFEFDTAPADVPTRVAYKVYSRDGDFLGELPNPTPLAFSQDKNSAGSIIEISCATLAENTTEVEAIQASDDTDILTAGGLPILATSTETVIAEGASGDNAIFKNSNRIKAYLYNYWYPNGKLMFSGDVNRINFKQGGGDATVRVKVISDGQDMGNFIARGYPFAYTTDVTQNSQNGYVTVERYTYGGWNFYGQTWLTGAGVTNVGQVVLKLLGTATVTLSIYDAPNGDFIGSVTKDVSVASATDVEFDFAQLLDVTASTSHFMAVTVQSGQSIRLYRHGTSSTYANGAMYTSSYAGGSGGGLWAETTGDVYFITKSGTPTTTTTYSTQDPIAGMASGIMADYNARGGKIKERNFQDAGLSLTRKFNQSSIYDAVLKDILELVSGYYAYIDLGTAEMDLLPISDTADFTIVRGKDVEEIDLTLTIEQVKNNLLFTGGDTGAGTNLYTQYQDSESIANYGLRLASKSDNRVTLTTTANAIGDTFIDENADEQQETTVTILNTAMDITLLTPGKTIGFRNFGSFINGLVLEIARRDFTQEAVTLTLGRLPVRMNDEIQRINRELLNEQTADNPDQPS